jgi:hypothetical protein
LLHRNNRKRTEAGRTFFTFATLLLLAAATPVATLASGMQCEGRASYYFLEPLRYVAPTGNDGFQYTTTTSADLSLADNFSLLLDHRLRTVNKHTLFPEQLYPFENYVYGGFSLDGPGTLTLGASNSYFRNVQSFPTPWYLPTRRITPQTIGGIDGTWNLETERFNASAAATYSMYRYRMEVADLFAVDDGERETGLLRDDDLWADVSASLLLNDDISIQAGGLTKQDLNQYRGYDLYRYRLGIAGSHRLNRNKIGFEWDAAERFTQSPVMRGNGFSTGFSTMLSSRLLWRIKSNLFIKGGAQAELGAGLHKLFFEAQLRKTWDNGANIDIGYFSTAGVRFPRQGLRLAEKIVVNPHLSIAGELRGYLCRLTGSQYRYYRSDLNLELLFPFLNRFELFIGGGYRNYDRQPLYASRAMICGGVRSW